MDKPVMENYGQKDLVAGVYPPTDPERDTQERELIRRLKRYDINTLIKLQQIFI